jgi:hypothetical protein
MPKRIAIVSSSCPPVGGGGVSSAQYNLYCALKRKGYDARIFTFGDYNVASGDQDIIRTGVPPWFEKLVATLTGLYFRLVDPGKVAYHVSEVASAAWPCLRLRRRIRIGHRQAEELQNHTRVPSQSGAIPEQSPLETAFRTGQPVDRQL